MCLLYWDGENNSVLAVVSSRLQEVFQTPQDMTPSDCRAPDTPSLCRYPGKADIIILPGRRLLCAGYIPRYYGN